MNFSFRIAAAATSPGSILVRIYEQVSAGSWTRTSQVFTPQMTPIPSAAVVYVAGSPAGCTANPCYLNSAGDGADGIGTGLKDAVEAVAASETGSHVIVLGSVALKDNAVKIDKQVSLEGSGAATLTTSGGSCANPVPMLEITAGGWLRGLTINGGGCTNRDLLVLNTPADYAIELNTLTGGDNAIHVTDNTGNITVRYNQIQGNSGYALIWEAGTAPSGLRLVANNIVQNRSGDPVECSAGAANPVANRSADHNYWGDLRLQQRLPTVRSIPASGWAPPSRLTPGSRR